MRNTKVLVVSAILLMSLQAMLSSAQDKKEEPKPAEKTAQVTPPPKEESSVTDHTLRIGSQTISYKATAGTILLKDEKGEPNASLFYIAYTKSDVKDSIQRPIAFIYNGGPGSSSVWLHMGAFGPRRVVTVDAKPTPPAPYKYEDNPDCLLDKSDLVFIDPVGTGFSHAVGKAQDKHFWGIDEDVKSLAQFITAYVSRNNRWNSSKYLIGESYGTFRSAALGNYLQSHDGMDLNGIVLISSVLDLGTLSFPPGQDLPYVLYLPSYAATAWYHKTLKEPPSDLNAFLTEARKFTLTDYAGALLKGSDLSPEEKASLLKRLSYFTGLSEEYISKARLRVKLPQFMEELQRSKGMTTGRLDARFTGPTFDLLGENAEYDPMSSAISGAFTAVFNDYVRQELRFGYDKTYTILSEVAGRQWNWKRKGQGESDTEGFPGAPNVGQDMVQALIANAHLRIQVENGIYDLATPFFATEYTMNHLGLPRDLEDHIHMNYYEAGHMMYLNDASRTKLKANIAAFIESSSAK